MKEKYRELESKFNESIDLGVGALGGVLLSSVLIFTPAKVVGYIGIGAGMATFTASAVTKKRLVKVGGEIINNLMSDQQSDLSKKDDEITRLQADYAELNSKVAKVKELGIQALALQDENEKLQSEKTVLTQEVRELTDKLSRLIASNTDSLSSTKDAVLAAIQERRDGLLMSLSKKESYPALVAKMKLLSEEVGEIFNQYSQLLFEATELSEVCNVLHWAIDELANAKVRMVRSLLTLRVQELEEVVQEWQDADLIPKSKLIELRRDCEARLKEFQIEAKNELGSIYSFAEQLEKQLPDDDKFFLSLKMKIQEQEEKIATLQALLAESRQIRYFDDVGWKSEVANKVIDHFSMNEIVCDACPMPIREVGSDLEFHITPRTRIGMSLVKADVEKVAEALEFPLGAKVKIAVVGKNIRIRIPVADKEVKKISPQDVLNRPTNTWGVYLGSEYHRCIFAATQSGKTLLADELNGLQYAQLGGEIEFKAITLKNDGNRDEEKVKRFVTPVFMASKSEYMEALGDIHKAIESRNEILQINPNHRFPRQVFQLDEYGEYYRLGNEDERKVGKDAIISLIQSGAGLSSETGKGIYLTLIAQNPYVSQLGLFRPDLAGACLIIVGEKNIRLFLDSDPANHGLDEEDLERLKGELKIFKEASRIASEKVAKETEKRGEDVGIAVRKCPENYYSLIIPSKGGLPPVIIYNPKPGEFTNGLIKDTKAEVKPTCPDCSTLSERRKGKSDRYYCDNQACQRQTFTWKGLA
jgi:cell division protein FtsB